MRIQVLRSLSLSVLFLAPAAAQASGFWLSEHGAAAMGRGSAFAALADDATAIYFNPAGIADLPGMNFTIGASLILPLGGYESTLPAFGTVNSAARGHTVPNIYFSHKFGETVAWGFGIFAPFGLGLDWPSNFIGRFEVDRVDLKTVYFNPTFAWKPTKEFSLGLGVDIAVGSAELLRNVAFPQFASTREGSAHLGASGAFGVSGNIGILYRPVKDFSLGVTYRARLPLTFSGKADFSTPAEFAALLPDQDAKLSATMPDIITLGLAFDLSSSVNLGVDFNYVLWSVIQELRIQFPNPPAGTTALADSVTPKNWRDAFTLRLGTTIKATEKLKVRFGFIFDMTPVPSTTMDPILPDTNRLNFSVGMGYKTGGFAFDWAYMYVHGLPRRPDNTKAFENKLDPTQVEPSAGQYTFVAHLLGMNFSYGW